MNIQQKCFIALGGVCVVAMAGSLIWIGFAVHPVAGVACIGIVAWWIGSSIAEVLEKNKEGK